MSAIAEITVPTIRFKLLRSRHMEGVKPNVKTYQVQKDPITKQTIHPIIETTKPLDKLFNAPGRPPKFERLTEIETPEPYNPLERQQGESIQEFSIRLNELANLARKQLEDQMKFVDKMTKEQLEDFVETEEIDLEGAKTTEAIRAKVKASLKGS